MTGAAIIGPLRPEHDKKGFSCGLEALDRYLQNQAGQDVRRRLANCFVAVPEGEVAIVGYYTLSAAGIPFADLPQSAARRLPRYPLIPAAILGRLAVDRRHRGIGLGAALVFDALERALEAAPAVFALVVDAKDDEAAAFYRHLGFEAFADTSRRLFLAVETGRRLLER